MLELLRRNHQVRLLLRKDAPHLQNIQAEKVYGDIFDIASLEKAMQGQDIVFHTAGMISYDPAKNDLLYQTNVVGTKNVVEAALKAKITKLVLTSSTAAIGINKDPSKIIDENFPFNAGNLGLAYFPSKYEAEQEVLKGVQRGLNAVIVNPGSIVGAGDRRRYAQCYPGMIYKFKPKYFIHGGINFVDVKDVVAGHILVMEKGRSGERYILGGENLSFANFIRKTNKIIGRKSPTRYIANFVMKFFSFALRILNVFGKKLHITPELISNVGTWHLFYSSDKAKRELGYQPHSVDNAIRETLDWLKAEKKI